MQIIAVLLIIVATSDLSFAGPGYNIEPFYDEPIGSNRRGSGDGWGVLIIAVPLFVLYFKILSNIFDYDLPDISIDYIPFLDFVKVTLYFISICSVSLIATYYTVIFIGEILAIVFIFSVGVFLAYKHRKDKHKASTIEGINDVSSNTNHVKRKTKQVSPQTNQFIHAEANGSETLRNKDKKKWAYYEEDNILINRETGRKYLVDDLSSIHSSDLEGYELRIGHMSMWIKETTMDKCDSSYYKSDDISLEELKEESDNQAYIEIKKKIDSVINSENPNNTTNEGMCEVVRGFDKYKKMGKGNKDKIDLYIIDNFPDQVK